MPIAPRMNQPVGPYDFWSDTLQPGLFGLYDRWTEQKPWPTPEQINAAVQNPGLLDREAMAGYAVDMAQPFAAKLGGLLGHMPIPEGGLFGITTWHGSPHKWTRPDISKVGTGEGAQAYGHGFYSADSKYVGETYQDGVKDIKTALTFGGRTIDQLKGSVSPEALEIAKTLNGQFYSGTRIDEMLRRSWVKPYLDELGQLEKSAGYLYKLDIPDEDVAKYLDWDKPLSEQAEKTQQALRAFADEWRDEDLYRNVIDVIDQPQLFDGSDLYQAFVYASGGPDRASRDIAASGIPGNRYLDGSSRSAGEGTYNYVTFDPSRIKVLERNGEDLRGLLGR